MIGIIDYGMGNLLSVYHALDSLGAAVTVCEVPDTVRQVDRVVLPGVGAFRDCMSSLKAKGFVDVLNEVVHDKGRPFLGICLGMQATARQSAEGGQHDGLSWFEADVVRLDPAAQRLRVPHIGWNNIRYRANHLFRNLPAEPEFYFVHSYCVCCDQEDDVAATCDYGGTVTVAIEKDNMFATQFHPEKSQSYGLQVLENFLDWTP